MPLPTRYGLYDPTTEHDACGVGFVVHIRGEKSRSIVEDALGILDRLSHRAACGADPETADGAGILLQLPHRFFKREGLRLGFDMPRRRCYGVGQVFLPTDPAARAACEAVFEEVAEEEHQRVIGWLARESAPVLRQIYIARRRVVPSAFERKLYVIRKLVENRVRERNLDPEGRFSICSLSAETIVYKGLLLPTRLKRRFTTDDEVHFILGVRLLHVGLPGFETIEAHAQGRGSQEF